MSSTGYYQYSMRTVVHSGPGSVVRVPALFEGMAAKRVLLISDDGLKQAGVVDQLVSLFQTNSGGQGPVLAGVFTEIAGSADCEVVNAVLRFTRERAADAILAVGGGTVQDVAKGVKYALHHQLIDIRERLQTGARLDLWPKARYMGIPHIAVATTAGSGAEVSPAAVLFSKELDIKCNLMGPFLEPDMAVLDANLTRGLSPQLTAAMGMAALSHALEAVASPLANHLSDAHAFRAAQLIVENLPLVVTSGDDVQARSNLLQASIMAANAFFASLNATPVRNCCHALGALYGIPHSRANAALLPVCVEVLPEFYLPSSRRLAAALSLDTRGKGDEALLAEVVACLQGLQETIGSDRTLTQWGVDGDGAEKIIAAVLTDPTALFYPIPAEKIIEIIKKVAG